MKTLRILVLAILASLPLRNAAGANLDLTVVPRFNNAPLVFDAVTNQTAAGQKFPSSD
jgi:hypothetical protein